MATLFLTHEACLAHETPDGHPERADRLRAIAQAMMGPAFDPLIRETAPAGTFAQAQLVHAPAYVEAIAAAAPQDETVYLDPDTVMSPGSLDAALRALGGAVAAVDAVVTGRVRNAFVATRPPGHHAERDRAMGFCLFNNAAAAARHAQRTHGLSRIAVIDWDVHHGNGTQDIFWDDASVLFASTHQMPLYPGSGAASERGEHGTILNVPLAEGDGSAAFRAAFTDAILPRLDAFRPELIVISAGFDAHRRDPLGGLDLGEDDFAWATTALMDATDRMAGGRIVSVLEGGYDLLGLSASVAAHVRALMQG